MEEVYRSHADRYHELVSAEDALGKLSASLRSLFDGDKASVFEAGVGTGRVTGYYIDRVGSAFCCDRSQHMLAFARQRFADSAEKLTFGVADNFDLPTLNSPVDIFIEGWSFGLGVVGSQDSDGLRAGTAALLRNATKNLKPGGTAIILETMGTNTDAPAPPLWELEAFYSLLQNDYGFDSEIIRTDFRFPSNERAAEVMGFFFGEEMEAGVRTRGTATIPEYTGIWYKRV
jgi:SAM-dependent methyltransferase